MPSTKAPSGWLDDVAAAAAWGASPIVVTVGQDPSASEETARWLLTAVPALGHLRVEKVPAAHVPAHMHERPHANSPTVFVVDDASDGTAAVLGERWRTWNTARDGIHESLRCAGCRDSVVLLVTSSRMPEIAAVAPELLGAAQVITVTSEPFAINPTDSEQVRGFRQARADLEAKYGMTTEELIGKLFRREPVTVPANDVRQWEAIAQALRNAEHA